MRKCPDCGWMFYDTTASDRQDHVPGMVPVHDRGIPPRPCPGSGKQSVPSSQAVGVTPLPPSTGGFVPDLKCQDCSFNFRRQDAFPESGSDRLFPPGHRGADGSPCPGWHKQAVEFATGRPAVKPNPDISAKCPTCGYVFDPIKGRPGESYGHPVGTVAVPLHTRKGRNIVCNGSLSRAIGANDPMPPPESQPIGGPVRRDREIVNEMGSVAGIMPILGAVASGDETLMLTRIVTHTPEPWDYLPAGDSDGETVGIDHFVMGDGGRVELACPRSEGDALLMAGGLPAFKILRELAVWFVNGHSPTPSSMFDESQTWEQVLGSYMKRFNGPVEPAASEWQPVCRLLALGLVSAMYFFGQRPLTADEAADRVLNTSADDSEGVLQVAEGLIAQMLLNPAKVRERLAEAERSRDDATE